MRNSLRYHREDRCLAKSFFDSSLRKHSKSTSDDSLKTLIRKGPENSYIIVVLAGTLTWQRRMVRNEMALSTEAQARDVANERLVEYLNRKRARRQGRRRTKRVTSKWRPASCRGNSGCQSRLHSSDSVSRTSRLAGK